MYTKQYRDEVEN